MSFIKFDFNWEQRKVNEIFKITRGQVLSVAEIEDNKSNNAPYPVYSSQTKNDGIMGYYKEFLFDTAITWTTDGANAGTVNYRKGKFYSTNVNGVLLSDIGYANKAIADALNKVAWKYVSKVGNPKLMNNVMGEITIVLPKNIKEHKYISTFLTCMDNLITLHQRRVELLKQIKKGYLQQMFPIDGENLPRIRFANFNENWNKRKFSNVFSFSVSNNTVSRAGLNRASGQIKNIHYGDILVKFDEIVNVDDSNIPYITDARKEDYKNQLLCDGDIIIADTAEDKTTGKAIELININDSSVVSGLHTVVARPDIVFAQKYLGYYLNSSCYHSQLLSLMQGIKVLSLSKKNIAKTEIVFPINVDEQVKISQSLFNLSQLINFQQKKIKKLKNLKKAYLQQMFI